ncbi:MAG: Sec-independent protein translocase TatA [Sphingomonas sp.]|uniref:twin-arginine translocase TatA/TatE family subunit n=1 Tax=Sphingomonas sp. TaxID=28214 RepID=UPI001212E4FC|nr:twin-arginine translocase TatA/TatE family subunit [Sphingomonas sp.]THD37711.1 MAG: Sec-independent protein translocase TatA [Sphingomonas sp.]
MGFGSPIHWIILGILAILVLGGGRFSNMMGDVAKGIKQFKKGMSEDDDTPPSRIEAKRADPVIDAERERVRDADV